MKWWFFILAPLVGFGTTLFLVNYFASPPLAVVVRPPPAATQTAAVVAPMVRPFTVLLVPGHDVAEDGASFNGVYERDLAAIIAGKMAKLLNTKSGYRVIVSRNTKMWNQTFADYFQNNEQAIIDFKNEHQAKDKELLASGQKKFVADAATHSTVNKRTAVQLYGLNKWAGENDVDLVVHLHSNDSGRQNTRVPGPYRGFTIFIPESQMVNASSSRLAAEDIHVRLKELLTPQLVGPSGDGILEDQSLIALGASGTLTKPSLLIEFAYIYEKMLRTEAEREVALSGMAEKTVAGIIDYADSLDTQ